MSKLSGKVAVVTGASRGIGAAIAKALAGMPADIAEIVVFLATNDARWLTGEELIASGGIR